MFGPFPQQEMIAVTNSSSLIQSAQLVREMSSCTKMAWVMWKCLIIRSTERSPRNSIVRATTQHLRYALDTFLQICALWFRKWKICYKRISTSGGFIIYSLLFGIECRWRRTELFIVLKRLFDVVWVEKRWLLLIAKTSRLKKHYTFLQRFIAIQVLAFSLAF